MPIDVNVGGVGDCAGCRWMVTPLILLLQTTNSSCMIVNVTSDVEIDQSPIIVVVVTIHIIADVANCTRMVVAALLSLLLVVLPVLIICLLVAHLEVISSVMFFTFLASLRIRIGMVSSLFLEAAYKLLLIFIIATSLFST